MDKKIEFNDFIATVPTENQDFVKELQDQLIELGCKIVIKTAKSGYMAVSYTHLDVYKRQRQHIRCGRKQGRNSRCGNR